MKVIGKSKAAAMFVAAIIICLITAVLFAVGTDAYADGAFNITEMTGSGFSSGSEDGTTVWTADESNDRMVLTPAGVALGTYNTVSFEVRGNGFADASNNERYYGMAVAVDANTEIVFEVLPYYRATRISLFKNGVFDSVIGSAVNYTSVSARKWHTAECTVIKNNLKFVFDETEITADSRNYEFDGNSVYFINKGVAPSYRKTVFTSSSVSTDTITAPAWNKTTEDGDIVYSIAEAQTDLKFLYYNEGTGNNNRISFSLRFGSSNLNDEWANFRLYVGTGKSGEYIAFQFIPYWKAVVAEKWRDGKDVGRLAEGNFAVDGSLSSDWFEFSCTLLPGYLRVDCDGNTVVECLTDEQTFENADMYLSCYNLAGSVKNIALYDDGRRSGNTWLGSGFTNDDGVYTAKADGGLKTLQKSEKTGATDNVFAFEVRPNSFQPDADGNAGFIIDAAGGSGVYLFFELMPKIGAARVRLILGNSGYQLGMSYYGDGSEEELNAWMTVKCVFERDLVAMFVNGVPVVGAFDTRGHGFSGSTCRMNVWKTGASFRNMELSHEDLDGASLGAIGYMDLDFTDERSLGAVSTENADAVYNTETKTADFISTGEDPKFSVSVTQNPGGRYSAYLPVRNTIFVVLRNGTSAEKLRLDFEADDKGVKREYGKDFPVEKTSGFKAYYLNVSDLSPRGYLKRFDITLVGAHIDETFSVKTITTERETPIYSYAALGDIECVADVDKNTVTVEGRVKPEYIGRTVTVVTNSVDDYDESDLSGKVLGSTSTDADGRFVITFGLKQGSGGLTYLGSFFMAYVTYGSNRIKLSHRFNIENYKDFLTVEPLTDIKSASVSVTDGRFGARGDGFTDDTDAIQAAVDYLAGQGGGKVIVPGDVSAEYGKRYIVTNIKMKDNIELVIEKGAVLWQSPRKSDYKYEPMYGHDALADAMWSHCGVVSNYPIIEIRQCKNVRVSGGGEIRMMDCGGEWLDGAIGYEAVDGHEIIIGCESRIHVTAIGLFDSRNVEISDLKVTRGGNWHIVMVHCSDLTIQNVHIFEAVCRNTDGYSFQNTQRVTLLRNSLLSNDDAIVLITAYMDLRDKTDWWWERKYGCDNSVSDIKFVGNNLHGGLGFVFIPWGSGDPDLSNTEIRDLEAYDNIFSGYQSVGCWADNPNYGISKGADYTGVWGEPTETDDYSPIKDIYLHDNYFPNGFRDLSWVANYKYLRAYATNFVNDADVIGATDFLNPSFERDLRYDNETEWVSGLSYWSSKTEEHGSVGYEKVGTKRAVARYSGNEFTVNDYAGYAEGTAQLFQGIYLERGGYMVTLNAKNATGTGAFFVGNPVTGEVFLQSKFDKSAEFEEHKIAFKAEKDAVYAIGVYNDGDANDRIYIDDIMLRRTSLSPDGVTEGERHIYGFENTDGFTVYPEGGVVADGGKLVTDANGDYAVMLDNKAKLAYVDLSVDIKVDAQARLDAGVYVCAAIDGKSKAVCGYNVQLTGDGDGKYTVGLMSAKDGVFTSITETEPFDIHGEYVTLRVTVKDNMLSVYTDGSEVISEVTEVDGGNIGLRSNRAESKFGNLVLYSHVFESGEPLTTGPSKPEKPQGDGGSGVNLGLAVGLPVGIVCAAALVVVLIYIRKRKRK